MRFYLLALLAVTGCGYSSKGNTFMGQVKKVARNTPLICSEFVDADISLGVMRNGQGSMSSEDAWFNVTEKADIELLENAAREGKLVEGTFDVARFVWCPDSPRFITSIKVVE